MKLSIQVTLRLFARSTALCAGLAAASCGAQTGGNGGATNWLSCDKNADCPSNSCVAARCVDALQQTDALAAPIPVVDAASMTTTGNVDASVPMLTEDSGATPAPSTAASIRADATAPNAGGVDLVSPPIALASGDAHTCALLEDGSVWCFGDNVSGQLGNGTTQYSLRPVDTGLSDIVLIAAGRAHTCAATASGEVLCWGDNEKGQVGTSVDASVLVPTPVVIPGRVSDLAAGADGTCVTSMFLHPECWGTDPSGVRYGPQQLAQVNDLLQPGMQVSRNGILFIDGDNQVRAMANWAAVPELAPDIGTPSVAVALGSTHDCRIKAGGSVWCRSSVPAPFTWQAKLDAPTAEFATGEGLTCSINEGSVRCQGTYIVGGLSSTSGAYVEPEVVQSLPIAKSLSVGSNHACSIGYDASIWCWGIFGPRNSTSPFQVSFSSSSPDLGLPPASDPRSYAGSDYVEAAAALAQVECRCAGTDVSACNPPLHPEITLACLDAQLPDTTYPCEVDKAWSLAHTRAFDCSYEAVPSATCGMTVMNCESEYLHCPGGAEAYASSGWCDGYADCTDSFDELHCPLLKSAAHAGSAEYGDRSSLLVWGGASPPVEGDGRLVDVPEAQKGSGWDSCGSTPRIGESTETPNPPARRGTQYLITAPPTDDMPNPPVPNLYLWPETTGTAQGLWFDLTLLSGTAEGATLTLSTTNAACEPQRTFGTFDLERGLETPSLWTTACVDVSAAGEIGQIGVRLDTPAGSIGIDAFRFDRPCE